MLKWFRKMFLEDELGGGVKTASHLYSKENIKLDDLPYMNAVKRGFNPPVVKRGWLHGYYDVGVRG